MPKSSQPKILIHDVTHTANFGDWMIGQLFRFWLAQNFPDAEIRYLTSVKNTRGVWIWDRFYDEWNWPTHIIIFGGSVWYNDRYILYDNLGPVNWLERLRDDQRLLIWGGIQAPFDHEQSIGHVLQRADLILTRFSTEIPLLEKYTSRPVQTGSDLMFLQAFRWQEKTGPAIIAGHLIKEFEPHLPKWKAVLETATGSRVETVGICCLEDTDDPRIAHFPLFWNKVFDCCLVACAALHAGILAAATCTPFVLIDMQAGFNDFWHSKYHLMASEFALISGIYIAMPPANPDTGTIKAALELKPTVRTEYAALKAEQARQALKTIKEWLGA